MADTVTPVRVFISSPGDLVPERKVVQAVLEHLNRSPSFRDRFKLIPYAWEQDTPALTGRGPQEVVNAYLLDPTDADIMVCMLWQRMGSPLEQIDPQSNEPYESGTAYEFFRAYRAFQQHGRPLLLLYRCLRAPSEADSADEEQISRVRRFFTRFSPGGDLKGLVGTFLDATDFETTLARDIALLLEREIGAEAAQRHSLGAPLTTPNRTDRRHGQLRGYALQELIGAGGFGAVYRAYHATLNREVAIKIIKPQYANHPDFIRRFEAEAQLVARLEHPHIVPLYDYWREPSGAYLVMRHVRGGSLATKLSAGPWSLTSIIRLLDQLTAALAYTHRHQIVHRDLKPANILLDQQEHAYLADFGIAQDLATPLAGGFSHQDLTLDSPVYLSPEQIRNEPVSPQTDIYSLGMILYELLTGVPPFDTLVPAEILAKQLHEPLPHLQLYRPDLPDALNTVIQRTTAKQPIDRYPNVMSLLADFLRVNGADKPRAALVVSEMAPASGVPGWAQGAAQASGAREPGGGLLADTTLQVENPYKGLRAFVEADAADFFGRAILTQRLLTRLAEAGQASRFLAVVGPSGSGKSSVVRAGLIPALRQGVLPGSEHWYVITMVPGVHPWEELEAALLRIAVNPPTSLLAQLQDDERGLARAVKRALPPDETTELVLIIDQFEELFTLVEDEAARVQVLQSLSAAAQDPRSRLRIIITLRADFYDRPLLYPELGELVRQHTEVVLPLGQDELHEVITRPVARVDVQLEPALVATLMHDVGTQPGVLPLLQYALTELFEQRVDSTLTLAAYQALGGLQAVLARRADELFESLDPAAQLVSRQLFLRLVTLGEGTEDTRRRVAQVELTGLHGASETLDSILGLYGRHRLLTFDNDPLTREPTVEVAHEALIRSWGRLRDWLDTSRDTMRLQRRLAAAASEWTNGGRDPSFLATGMRLNQLETLASESSIALTHNEEAYLVASLQERDRGERTERERQAHELELAQKAAQSAQQTEHAQGRAANRLRALVVVLAVFLLVAAGLSIFALDQQGQALQSAATANANLIRSEALRLAAEARRLAQTNGDPILIALLSIRSMQMQPLPEGDQVLGDAAATALPLHLFGSQDDRIIAAAFSPDDRMLLTAGLKGAMHLWDTQSGAELRSLTGHTGNVTRVMFSPDGQYVITGGSDGMLRLWDVQTGVELRSFERDSDTIDDLHISSNGALILTRGTRQLDASSWKPLPAQLRNAQTGEVLRTFPALNMSALSPDGHYVLTDERHDDEADSGHIVYVWDAQTDAPPRRFTDHPGIVYIGAMSPDNRYMLTSGSDGTIQLWDVVTASKLHRFTGHTGIVTSLAFSADSKYALTGSSDRTVRLWDVQSGQQLLLLPGAIGAPRAVFSSNGRYALTTDGMSAARLWALQPYNVLVGHRLAVTSLGFSFDGKYVLSGSRDGTARLWDARSGVELHHFDVADIAPSSIAEGLYEPVRAAFSPDGRYILTVHSMPPIVGQVWSSQGQPVHTLRVPGFEDAFTSAAAYAPDGTFVLMVSYNHVVHAWDPQTGQLMRSFHLNEQNSTVRDLAISLDSRYALTGDDGGVARLWDLQTGQQVQIFASPGADSSIISVAYSPDGKHILTGDDGGTARLWDVSTRRIVHTFSGHSSAVGDVTFSPDGTTILTGSADQTIRVWNAQTGVELRHLAFTNRVAERSIVVSTDGKRLLIGGADAAVRLLDLDYHDMIVSICTHLPRDFTVAERAQYGINDKEPTCAQPKP
jgi:WD40 repeat protein